MAALDIEEVQVAIDFAGDANFTWHVRVLVAKLGEGGRWVGFSPDLEAEVVDLADHRVVPLARGAPFPARIANDVYYREQISDDELRGVVAECRALAAVLGPGPAPALSGAADWIYRDPAFDGFGEVVRDEYVRNPLGMVIRDAIALVRVARPEGPEWTVAERVLSNDVEAWKDEKRSGPGRDPRVLPVERDARGSRFRNVRDALAEAIFVDPKAPPPGWPFEGPPAVRELLTACRAAGEELAGFHDFYLRSSGLSVDHPTALKHRDLMTILFHFASYDQVNLGQLSGIEALARYVLQIHQAVRRSPKNPDFRGTGLMVQSTLDSNGSILSGDFARYVAEEQKTHAFTLKQQRLYAEEEEKRRGRGGGGGGGGQGGPSSSGPDGGGKKH